MLSLLTLSWLALRLANAQKGGSMIEIGDTQVSAMMMFVGNEDKVYILDKVEDNAAQIDGHPAWASEWDLSTNTVTLMPLMTNTFCAAGMHFPNGTWATFGGNKAVGPSCNPSGGPCAFDPTYGDDDGSTAVRLLTPCPLGATCDWKDDLTLNLVKKRWYPGIEALGDGSVVLIGGFVNGGYINRNYPNVDPLYSKGAAEPTFEFWPPRPDPPAVMQFMGTTSGLNSYAHAYLMPSGKMFVQANISTIMWDVDANLETPLPDMPGNIARVYPASGAVTMLPLTPDNNYEPTILFCGGIALEDDQWGNYQYPAVNTFNIPNSNNCQRITPEPQDLTQQVKYIQDDDMLESRSMGQFIILPDETLLIINGGSKGTAGYATMTGQTHSYGEMPFGMSLSSGPVLTPALYNPIAPAGQRWSNSGFQASQIPRLYHSSAVLLPDASVMIAGSNPNVDVNTSTIYPTTYKAEKFYPSYFNAPVRPSPDGVPKNLSYGGQPFDLTFAASSWDTSKMDANAAAALTKVIVIRPGFSTHAMNMGQKALRLNTTYNVSDVGTVTIHVSQMPPNPNLFQPGPAFLYTVINGVPSNGTMVIIGNGKIGQQDIDKSTYPLPPSSNSTKNTSQGNSNQGNNSGAAVALGVPSSSLFTVLGMMIATAFGAILF